MSTGGKQPIHVYAHDGRHLGTVKRHMRTALWRASGQAQPVWLGGAERPVHVVGYGADARLEVHLPYGAPLPKELRHG